MVGLMGCVMLFVFGFVFVCFDLCVVVVDGDGVVLMWMGVFVMFGIYGLVNFMYVLFDNGVYELMGG